MSTLQTRCGSLLALASRMFPDMEGLMVPSQWGKTAEHYTAMLGRVNIREVAGRKVVGEKISEVLDARHEAEWHAAQETGGGD